MTDSSSQSDDTSGCCGTTTTRTSRGRSTTNSRRRKGQLNAKERNLRRLESNERERMRMHSLNDAFQVCNIPLKHSFIYILQFYFSNNNNNLFCCVHSIK